MIGDGKEVACEMRIFGAGWGIISQFERGDEETGKLNISHGDTLADEVSVCLKVGVEGNVCLIPAFNQVAFNLE